MAKHGVSLAVNGGEERPRQLFLDSKETAAILGLSKTTLYAMCQKKQIPHIRFAGQYRFPIREIEEWAEGLVVHPRKR